MHYAPPLGIRLDKAARRSGAETGFRELPWPRHLDILTARFLAERNYLGRLAMKHGRDLAAHRFIGRAHRIGR
jgi:hypothetical protein